MDAAISTAHRLTAWAAAFKSSAHAVGAGKGSVAGLVGHLVELGMHVDQLVHDLRASGEFPDHATRAELFAQLEVALTAKAVQERLARRLTNRVERAQEITHRIQARLDKASTPPWKSAQAAALEARQEVGTLLLVLRGEV